MTRQGASRVRVETVRDYVQMALSDVQARRSALDTPLDYPSHNPHPWTQDFALALARTLHTHLRLNPESHRHEVAAHWRTGHAVPDLTPIRLSADALYTTCWRVYAPDDSALIQQALAAELHWGPLSRACDRLAQARASLRLLASQADPARQVGGMTLAQACAYRIAAFAPPGETVLLAFYSPDTGWRAEAGFDCFSYVTGARGVTQL